MSTQVEEPRVVLPGEFIEPPRHVEFISREKGLAWAQYMGLPYATKHGMMQAFKRKGGVFGKKANAPHPHVPIPVDQFRQFLGGYKIRPRKVKGE